jgi:hypothetical protein
MEVQVDILKKIRRLRQLSYDLILLAVAALMLWGVGALVMEGNLPAALVQMEEILLRLSP